MNSTVPIIEFPMAPPGTMGPPTEYADLRAHCPIAKVAMPFDATAWYITRYADVRALIADPRLVRPTINDWPARSADSDAPGHSLTTMMELDGPRHTALRKAVAAAFRAGSVRNQSARLRELADRLLVGLRAGGSPGDLVAGFTEPFPLLVMCDIVGIPPEECDQFLPILDSVDAMVTPEEAGRTAELLRDYVGGLIARKQRKPGQDILTQLVDRWQVGLLTHEDVVVFGLSMVASGFVTSSMFLANSVLALLRDPGQYAALRDNREIMPTAVAELLRYVPALNGTVLLLATEDVPIREHTIGKGEAVILTLASANRDDSVFADPDRLDLRRAVNPHIVFGRGTHNCFGAHLARAELTIGLEALLDRFPELHLADGHQPTWDDESPSKSPLTLPVGW